MLDKLLPAAFVPLPESGTTVYYVSFPQNWEDKLFNIECLKKDNLNVYNLPTKTLEKLVLSWLPGVASCNPIGKGKDNTKWFVSSEPVDKNLLVELMRVWVISEYIENKKVLPEVKHLASAFFKEMNAEYLDIHKEENLVLFDREGKAACSEAFRVFPLTVIKRLSGQEIALGGKNIKLLYAGNNELITEPVDLFAGTDKRRDHFSIAIQFSVQTIPPSRKTMLIYKTVVRRWIGVPSKPWDFGGNATTAYIKTAHERLQPITCKLNKKDKLVEWDNQDKKCYEFSYFENTLPELNELIKAPNEFISKDIGAVVLTYRYAQEMKKHLARPGLPMIDRIRVHEALEDKLAGLAMSANHAYRVHKRLSNLRVNMSKMDREVFRKRMVQAIGTSNLAIEIYCNNDSDIGEKVYNKIKEQFGVTEDTTVFKELTVNIRMKPLGKNGDVLDPNLKELERFEGRIAEIKYSYGEATIKPTACIVVLPGKESFSSSPELDPKNAIRAGFAQTGRLTQFIRPVLEENEGEDEAESSQESRISSAIYDLYRQLGLLFPYSNNGEVEKVDFSIPAMSVHIVNYKKTLYGSSEPFPLFVTVNYKTGRITVDCGFFSRPELLYWEACLEFQKVQGKKNIKDDSKKAKYRKIKSKILELINTHSNPILVLVESNGISRKVWKFIADSELAKVERRGNSLNHLLFDPVEPEQGINLSTKDNSLRIIRVRSNEEVPGYLSEVKESGATKSISGVFKYDDVFWSIASAPNDILFRNSRSRLSKVERPNKECKRPDMIEFYPIHLQDADSADDWVYLAHKYREFAHQYKEALRLPLPLHLAKKLEEYMG